MTKHLGMLVGIVMVALIVAFAIIVPTTTLAPPQITLTASRMVACPVGDPALGQTLVRLTDQQEFSAGLMGELPGDPVTLAAYDNPAKPVIARGSATVSGVSAYTESGHTMIVPCAPPVTSGTWNGVVTRDNSATLILTDVDAAAAVVDVFLYNQTGPIPIAGLRDITVTAGTPRMLALDQLAYSDTPISVAIRASRGRVAALLRVVGPQGYDWQLPQTSAGTELVIAGVPGGDGARTLSVTNADPTAKAVVKIQILSQSGPFSPLGIDSFEILPTRTTTIDITQALGGQGSAVQLTSDSPITASINVGGPDATAISAQPGLGGTIVIPPIGGMLWFANPTAEQASVTIRWDDGTMVHPNGLAIPAQSIISVDLPSNGPSVSISTDTPQVRASLTLTDASWSILPLTGGGIATTVDAPRLDPGLG